MNRLVSMICSGIRAAGGFAYYLEWHWNSEAKMFIPKPKIQNYKFIMRVTIIICADEATLLFVFLIQFLF